MKMGERQNLNEILQVSVLTKNSKGFLERNHIVAILRGVVFRVQICMESKATEPPLFARQQSFAGLSVVDFSICL